MDKIRISAVKYANTYPFIYGLTNKGFDKSIVLETDHPADCAKKLIEDRVDIGLIPVASIPLLDEYHIIGDYCIGTKGKVRTVMLLTNSAFNEIDTIYLDYRSRSSVNLARVLAKYSWKKEFKWVNTTEGFDFRGISSGEAVVLIGDQCFEFEKSFKTGIDLATEWKKFSGLPFVFACWVANKKISPEFIFNFNLALRTGVNDIDAVVEKYGSSGIIKGYELKLYLTENIDFKLDEDKKKALELFLDLMSKLEV